MGEVLVGKEAACRPEPLIFPRYDFGLALDNTARAGENHEITVVAYYQARLTAAPAVTSLRAEATFDGGSTWHPATTRATGKNTFTTTIRNPSARPSHRGRRTEDQRHRQPWRHRLADHPHGVHAALT